MKVGDIVAKLKRLPDFQIQKKGSWFNFMRVVDREEILKLIKELEKEG